GMIYTDTLREEEGGTYGAATQADFDKFPREQATLIVQFDTNTEASARLIEVAKKGIQSLAEEGPTDEQMTRTIENFKKKIPENRLNNNWWLTALNNSRIYGYDYDAEYEAAISKVSADSIKAFMKKFLAQGNYIEIKMDAE
ncbi:MAG: hypothetical protein MJY56_03755, partial [Bacteroidales bacterium]|nr:hypothetical protein [Bacteroidales bacterium]